MSRQLDQAQEEKTQRYHMALVRAIEFELEGTLGTAGAVLSGLSFKIDEMQCLMTIRAILDDEPHIAFIGADSMGNALLKGVHACKTDKLRWRADKYAVGQD